MKDYVGSSLTILFLCIFTEFGLSQLWKKKTYRTLDVVNNLSHAVVEQLIFALTNKTIEYSTYHYIHSHIGLSIDLSWSLIIFTVLGIDFFYYWFHRMAHEINFLWASHNVHHSSEDFNLTVALRQSIFQVYLSWIFYLPLALLVPTEIYYINKQINGIAQFWIHADINCNLGPIEWIINCPTHHRVHHARNPEYLDKNYGGIFIIWDRLFGTFKEENVTPLYGLTTPINKWNIIYGQLHHYYALLIKVYNSNKWDKLRSLIYGPGWFPNTSRLGDAPPLTIQDKYTGKKNGWFRKYIILNFVLTTAHAFVYFGIMDKSIILFHLYSYIAYSIMLDNESVSKLDILLELIRLFFFIRVFY